MTGWDIINAILHRRYSGPTWIAPTFQNGWVNYGGEYELAGYCMDAEGFVHLRGLVKSGTVGSATPIFTLPSPYIPAYSAIFPVVSADAFAELRVEGSGDANPGAVQVYSGGSNTWVSLSGISFGATA